MFMQCFIERPTLVYEGEKLVVDLVAQTLQFTPDPISLIQSKGAEAPDTHYEAVSRIFFLNSLRLHIYPAMLY